MSEQALQLLHDYNDYLVRTAHWKKLAQTKPVTRRRASAANIAAMKELAEWCAQHEIEPRVWLHSLFDARHWTYAPPFPQLRSHKHLQRFKTMRRGSTHFSARVQRESNEAAVQSHSNYDPNRDVTATVENLKRHYLDSGQPQSCISSLQETLGFHPRSLVCARCPYAQPCAQQLQAMVPFDIQALRRGEITAAHAQHVAMLHGRRS